MKSSATVPHTVLSFANDNSYNGGMKKTRNAWFLRAVIVLVCLNLLALGYVYLNQPTATALATAKSVAETRERGLAWLANNFLDSGIFLYNFDPEENTVPNTSNELRQLMASRVAASESADSELMAEIHAKNLDFIFQNWYLEDENGGFILYQDKSKLGASAMLLRTLVYSPRYEAYKHEAAMLAKGIKAVQEPDGSFKPWYIEPDYAYDAQYLMHFYSGEALLALLEYYEKSGDAEALATAQLAAEFYLKQYVENINDNYHPAYVPWHTMSYHRLYGLTKDERYAQAAFTLNDRLLNLLDTESYQGRFYKKELADEGQEAPHSSSDAVYLEGLLYAYELAIELKDDERAERYKTAIDLAAGRLIQLQYKVAQPGFRAPEKRYLGAIPIREGNPAIRVDTTQHALDAFEKYLKLFPVQ